MRAVVLHSGGLDSTTVLMMALSRGYEVLPLSIRYGQRHEREMRSAQEVRTFLQGRGAQVLDPLALEVDLRHLGQSSLVNGDLPLPGDRSLAEIGTGIPSTYVPFRNGIFLALAISAAEGAEAERVFAGMNAVDYSGYPDCRPPFVEAMERAARLGTQRGDEGLPFAVEAPLIRMSKAEIVRTAEALGAPLHLTWSCYAGGGEACGICDSCRLRIDGFRQAGIIDPVPYRTAVDWTGCRPYRLPPLDKPGSLG